MKTTLVTHASYSFSQPMRAAYAMLGIIAAVTISTLQTATAANVTLSATNVINTSSFATSLSWSNAAAPSSGNDYSVSGGFALRTVADSGSATFAGDSLTLGNNTTSGSLVLKNQASGAVVTINNLTLNNGEIQAGATSTGAANVITIAGNGITLAASTAANRLNTGAVSRGLIITAPISGSGALTVTSAGTATLNAANTYTGATTISSTSTLALGGTTGALSTSSTITNNGTFAITRTNAVAQGTDFTSTAISGTGGLSAIGTGLTLTLSSANTYSGTTTIGTGQNNSVLRATATGALGSGTIQFDTAGNSSSARLELSGGITLSNAINMPGRNSNSVSIQSISGNNTLSGNISISAGGANYYVQSDADKLTLSGNVSSASGGRTFTLQGAGDGVVSGNIVNGGGLNSSVILAKTGSGTWELTGTNSYTGATNVSAGKLVVTSSISTSTGTNVSGTGILSGNGAVGVLNVQSGGTVAPGNAIESLAAGNVSFASGSTLAYELNTSTLNGDLLDSSGTLNIAAGSVLTLNELASATRPLGDKLTLINYGGAWNGGLFNYLGSSLADDSLFILGNNIWQFNYNDTSGGSNFTADQSGAAGYVTMTVVPEPGAAILGSLGMLALLRRRR